MEFAQPFNTGRGGNGDSAAISALAAAPVVSSAALRRCTAWSLKDFSLAETQAGSFFSSHARHALAVALVCGAASAFIVAIAVLMTRRSSRTFTTGMAVSMAAAAASLA